MADQQDTDLSAFNRVPVDVAEKTIDRPSNEPISMEPPDASTIINRQAATVRQPGASDRSVVVTKELQIAGIRERAKLMTLHKNQSDIRTMLSQGRPETDEDVQRLMDQSQNIYNELKDPNGEYKLTGEEIKEELRALHEREVKAAREAGFEPPPAVVTLPYNRK